MKKNKKGFTLAELLIVVAIIAVLVAISIPIFARQKLKAQEAVDMANLRSAYSEVIAAATTDPDHSWYVPVELTHVGTKTVNGNIYIQFSTVSDETIGGGLKVSGIRKPQGEGNKTLYVVLYTTKTLEKIKGHYMYDDSYGKFLGHEYGIQNTTDEEYITNPKVVIAFGLVSDIWATDLKEYQ